MEKGQNKNGNQMTIETILADTIFIGGTQIHFKSSLLLKIIAYIIPICQWRNQKFGLGGANPYFQLKSSLNL